MIRVTDKTMLFWALPAGTSENLSCIENNILTALAPFKIDLSLTIIVLNKTVMLFKIENLAIFYILWQRVKIFFSLYLVTSTTSVHKNRTSSISKYSMRLSFDSIQLSGNLGLNREFKKTTNVIRFITIHTLMLRN